MEDLALEFVVEVAELVGLSVLTSVLGTIGILAERVGIEKITSGGMIGYWFAFVGLVALVAGYWLVRDALVPRFRDLRGHDPAARGE